MLNINNKDETPFQGFSKSLLNTQSILDVFVLQDILEQKDAETLKKTLKTNREAENFLVKNRLVSKDTVNKAYSIILKLPYISLTNVQIKEDALAAIPRNLSEKYGILAFDINGRLVRLAISKPADLIYGFIPGLTQIFESKKFILELFITGVSDFQEASAQYKNNIKNKILLNKGSLPVIALKGSEIPEKYLKKVPRDFIEKYRVVVFDKNVVGDFMVACEEPDSPLTRKVLSSLEEENDVKLEVFAASKDDMDYSLLLYDGKVKDTANLLDGKKGIAEEKNETEPSNTSAPLSFKTPLVDSIKSIMKRKSKEPTVIVDESHNDYGAKKPTSDIIEKTELPAVLDLEFIQKLPKDFVDKYHVVVFGEGKDGNFMVGTDRPKDPLTKKAIEFIQDQHELDVYEISGKDFERILSQDWTADVTN